MLNSFQTLQPNSVAPSLHSECDKPSGLGFNFMETTHTEKLIGLKYGKWTIISFVRVGISFQKIVKVKCECGTVKERYLSTLKSGASLSCGCSIKRKIKHGMTKSRLYNTWRGMRERCNNVKFKQYKDYGGRGIKVYHYWNKSFSSFLYWAIKNGYKEGLEIDRIDNNKDYEPSNCQFNTHKGNNRNKRDNRYIEFNGDKKALAEWSEIFGLNSKTIGNRIDRGWSVQDAFNTSIRKNQYK